MGIPSEEASVRAVLKNRPFLALWLAQVLSQTAQNAILYALLVLVEEHTGSTLHMSVLVLSAIVPSIAFGLPSGILVDHVRKKTVLVTTNLLRGVAVLGYLLFSGTMAVVYLVNLAFFSISQFFAPAEAASIPMLVKRPQLIAANGLFNITFTVSQLVGFVVVGPPLVKWFGPETAFVVIAASFAIAALLVSLLPGGEEVRRPLRALRRATVVQEMREELTEGWNLLRRHQAVSLAMFHLTFAAGLMLVMGMLAPGFVSRVLGVRADDAVFVLAPAGLGILLGTLILPQLASRFRKEGLINTGLLVMSLAMALLAVARKARDYIAATFLSGIGLDFVGLLNLFLVVMVLAFVVGLMYSFVNVPAQTILMERTPPYMRGKIFAVQLVLGYVASVLPLLFMGGLADLLGITAVLLLVAATVFGVFLFSAYHTRKSTTLSP